jgi:hypothetical protein
MDNVGVIKGEKVGQIDTIYVRGKFKQSMLGNSKCPQSSDKVCWETLSAQHQSINDGPLASIF